MRIYIPNAENLYADAKVRIVPGHPDRAVISVSNHMSVEEWFPMETDGWQTDGSILFSECMGFDPEEFDPQSEETRKWVERFSYPLEAAAAIVKQVNETAAK